MKKVLFKNIIFILLISLSSSQLARADVRNYQYDGKLPFVQMMLNMMVAMGILDRVPVNGVYGSYGMQNNQRYNQRNNRYINQYGGTSWRNLNRGGVDWGQPRWGVLPGESYSLNNFPSYQSQIQSPMAGSTDLTGWVNEPWEMSVWNKNNQLQQSSSSKNSITNQHASNGQTTNQQTTNQLAAKQPNRLKQKACVTDFCGLRGPDLNGLWVSQEGEMLGVKNNRYLWSDGQSRHLTGNIKLQNHFFVISVEGHQQLMRFKYKVDGNYLLTVQPNGKVREFRRVSNEQSANVFKTEERNRFFT